MRVLNLPKQPEAYCQSRQLPRAVMDETKTVKAIPVSLCCFFHRPVSAAIASIG